MKSFEIKILSFVYDNRIQFNVLYIRKNNFIISIIQFK